MAFKDRAVPDDQTLGSNVAENDPWRLDLYFLVSLDLSRNLPPDEDRCGNDFSTDSCLFTDGEGAVERSVRDHASTRCRCLRGHCAARQQP